MNKGKTEMQKPLSESSKIAKDVFNTIASLLNLEQAKEIKWELVEFRTSTMITVEAHPNDHGKLIGTHGVMINALQPLFAMIGFKHGIRMRFSVNTPMRQASGDKAPFMADPNWNFRKIEPAVQKVFEAVLSKPFEVSAADVGDKTIFEIVPSADDPAIQNAPALERAIAPIFHAIGKAQGRNEVIIDLAKAPA